MKVIVYSTDTCPWCDKLKEWLKENKVAFEEKNVGEDEKAAEEMIKKSGQMGVPVTEIKTTHGVGIVVGFDVANLKKLLKLK